MALTIRVRSGDSDSAPSITFDAPRIVIGRGEGCEVRLPDPSVSHRHASIRQRGTEYIVLDEGSSNGTFVGPVRLSPQAPRMLKSGDLVRVGRVWIEVLIEQAPPTVNAPLATRELALALVESALAAEGAANELKVRVVDGPSSGAELTLGDPKRVYVAGRLASADLFLDDPDLSRRHVEVMRRAERLIVRDLGSKNGSKLGERLLTAGEEAPWGKGESLVMGKTRLVYDDPVGDALEELEKAGDERIRDSELIEPPKGTLPSAADDARAEESAAVAAVTTRRRRAAPVSMRPKRTAPPEPSGWTIADLLVAFLAVIVLGLSVAGLIWLMRTG